MTDCFAEFGLPHSAWLEAEEIKSRHHQLIAAAHPDKPGGEGGLATRLNEARRVLESHPRRLRHLVELLAPEFGPTNKVVPNWELFSKTGETAREAATLAEQLARASSPIVRAGLLAKAKASKLRLFEVKTRLQDLRAHLENETRCLRINPLDAARAWMLAEEWTFLERLSNTLRDAETALITA